jgi:hypothetical protein
VCEYSPVLRRRGPGKKLKRERLADENGSPEKMEVREREKKHKVEDGEPTCGRGGKAEGDVGANGVKHGGPGESGGLTVNVGVGIQVNGVNVGGDDGRKEGDVQCCASGDKEGEARMTAGWAGATRPMNGTHGHQYETASKGGEVEMQQEGKAEGVQGGNGVKVDVGVRVDVGLGSRFEVSTVR